MEYQKITNLLDNEWKQLSKFRTKNWVEINDNSRGTYNANKQIKFKTTMLKSSLYDYNDAYILVKGKITVDDTSAAGAAANNTDKKVIFKNFAPFTKCISKINKTQVDNAKDIDIVDIDNVEIMVPSKYLSNFWRSLEMPLINCEVNLRYCVY